MINGNYFLIQSVRWLERLQRVHAYKHILDHHQIADLNVQSIRSVRQIVPA